MAFRDLESKLASLVDAPEASTVLHMKETLLPGSARLSAADEGASLLCHWQGCCDPTESMLCLAATCLQLLLGPRDGGQPNMLDILKKHMGRANSVDMRETALKMLTEYLSAPHITSMAIPFAADVAVRATPHTCMWRLTTLNW